MIPTFRAWDKQDEVICDVDVIGFGEGAITLSNENISYYHTSLSDVELMQSTGLKDKNDEEIFEGDIVDIELVSGKEMTTVVSRKYSNGGFFPFTDLNPFTIVQTKILGNIYENPELLEVED